MPDRWTSVLVLSRQDFLAGQSFPDLLLVDDRLKHLVAVLVSDLSDRVAPRMLVHAQSIARTTHGSALFRRVPFSRPRLLYPLLFYVDSRGCATLGGFPSRSLPISCRHSSNCICVRRRSTTVATKCWERPRDLVSQCGRHCPAIRLPDDSAEPHLSRHGNVFSQRCRKKSKFTHRA